MLNSTELPSNFSNSWKIEDLIDFEYLLSQGARPQITNETEILCADEFFQSKILPVLQVAGETSRRSVFRSWLKMQRDNASPPLPGKYWKSAWQLLVVLSILAGVGLGGSVTATLLLYRGGEPVNVPWFLACTLGVQFLVLIIAAVLWSLRRTTGLFEEFRPLLGGFVRAMNSGVRKLPGEQRDRLTAIFANLDQRRDIYANVVTWPFVVVTQTFGVFFNVGIVAVLLVHVSFKDIEFGWQSSFVHNNELVYRIAAGMAAPWKWFAPYPHPTLTEVADSHFQYKQERSNKSWWPFLCYSVTCYGLLIRGGLLICALVKWHRAMRCLKFDHEGCPTLYRRLIGPPVRSMGSSPALEIPPTAVAINCRAPSGEAFAIIATEVEISEEILTGYIRDNYGWTLAASQKAQVDHPGGNVIGLASLAEKAASLAAVIVVVPADRPPIKAIALFLGKVSKSVATMPELILLLVGRKESNGFGAVDETNFTYWQNFVAINKLKVSLESWSAK